MFISFFLLRCKKKEKEPKKEKHAEKWMLTYNASHCEAFRAHFVPFASGKSFIVPIITARGGYAALISPKKFDLYVVNNKCFAMQ